MKMRFPTSSSSYKTFKTFFLQAELLKLCDHPVSQYAYEPSPRLQMAAGRMQEVERSESSYDDIDNSYQNGMQ